MPRRHLFLVCLATLIVYAGVLAHRFIGDDFPGIVSNRFIKSPQNLSLVFSKRYLSPLMIVGHRLVATPSVGSGESTYRPVVTLTYFLDYAIWKLRPFGFHLTNLLLHLANAILMYFLAWRITRIAPAALLASLLFALHPVNAEAVNVVSFREDLLVFLFYIGALLLFPAFLTARRGLRFVLISSSAVLFLLALFSKEMAVTLPAILAIYYLYFIRGKVPHTGQRISPWPIGVYFCVLAFYLWVWGVWIGGSDIPARYPGGTFYTGLCSMIKGFGMYVRWFLWPVDVHAVGSSDSDFIAYSWHDAGTVVSFFCLFAIVALALRCRRVFPAVSFGIAWIFVTLLPVSNIWPINNPIASRYLYLPAAGFCLLAGSLLAATPRFKGGLAVILIVFYSMFSFIQNGIYKNQGTYLLTQRERYPQSSRINSDLGNYFFGMGSRDLAIDAYKTALAFDSGDFLSFKNLGRCYYEEGKWHEAADAYARALALKPEDEQVTNALGYVYMYTGRFDAARRTWSRLSPRYPQDTVLRENIARAQKFKLLFAVRSS